MSTGELHIPRSEQAAIIDQLLLEVRPDYEPPMRYHGWDNHILPGMKRIDELEASGLATDVENWLAVRFGYACHDRFLTQTKLDPTLLEGVDCAERIAADATRASAHSFGLGEAFADAVHYGVMATDPKQPCDTPEARAICRVDIGNTGDRFDIFFRNFVLVQLEDMRIDQLMRNPLAVAKGSCDFLEAYLRRSSLSLGPEDNFQTRVEQNLASLQSMGAAAIKVAIANQFSPKKQD